MSLSAFIRKKYGVSARGIGPLALMLLLQGVCLCHAACERPSQENCVIAAPHEHSHEEHHSRDCARLLQGEGQNFALVIENSLPCPVEFFFTPLPVQLFCSVSPVDRGMIPEKGFSGIPPDFLLKYAFRC